MYAHLLVHLRLLQLLQQAVHGVEPLHHQGKGRFSFLLKGLGSHLAYLQHFDRRLDKLKLLDGWDQADHLLVLLDLQLALPGKPEQTILMIVHSFEV